MPELVAAQRTDEWKAARIGRMTASVAAAALGWHPYSSPRRAWREILGMEPERQNRAMQWGVQFEAAARLDYEAETGECVEPAGFWIHPVCTWLGASPDGFVRSDGLVEIKCPTNCPRSIPLHHRVQMLVQLAVCERSWCDYFAWGAPYAPGDPERPYKHGYYLQRIYRSGIPGLICRLKEWFDAYVVTGIEPPRQKRRRKPAKEAAHG